ncbi:MAG TPA: CDP-diacylglycerol--serine O-phosphatidyltransferase [Chromobacteriaceae bacterium]|nr:CDP-diacylglycerol--serine O-phosphatidyltransferase [Chromobacteriaceae bacterium]
MAFLLTPPSLERLPKIALDAADFITLNSPLEFRQTLLKAIAQAEQRIYIAALYLENDEAGQEVLAALYQAKTARPQLDIRILVDWHRAQRGRIGEASQSCNARWYQAQRQLHNVDLPIYGIPVQTRELFGVLHLKGFVVDNSVLYSGASLNNVYLHKQERYRLDRYHLIHNARLAESMASFIARYFCNDPAVFRLDQPVPTTRSIRHEIRQFRNRLCRAKYTLPGIHASQDELSIMPLAGLGKNNPLNHLIIQLLSKTRQKLIICTPYFNFPLAITRAINHALRNGVEIEIIIGDKTANDFYIPESEPFKLIGVLPYLYEMNLRRFIKKHQKQITQGQLHIRLWQQQEHTYHLKGIWSDDQYILLTGNNLNPRAFRLDLENALLIHDPKAELKEQSQQEQQRICQDTRLIEHYRELESPRHYPVKIRKLLTRLSRVRIDRMLNLML